MSPLEIRYEKVKEDIIQTFTDFINKVEASTYLEGIGINDETTLIEAYIEVVKSQTSLMTFVHDHKLSN